MARILVVEDGKAMARILTHYLRKAGHAPIVTSTGEAALRAAATQPDLILLDAERPDLPIAGILGRLQRQPVTAQIPVVLLAGESGPEAHGDGGVHAVAAVLQTPMLFPELYAVVDAVLNPSVEPAPENRTTTERRVRLILRLITEGSDQLVRQICERLETDRALAHEDAPGGAHNWADLARAGRQEGLLTVGEGALLAACDGPGAGTNDPSAESATLCGSARAHRREGYRC